MTTTENEERYIDKLVIDTIRTLSMDAVQHARSGHPGTAMALAPLRMALPISPLSSLQCCVPLPG